MQDWSLKTDLEITLFSTWSTHETHSLKTFPVPLFSCSVPSKNSNCLWIWISPYMGQAVYYFKTLFHYLKWNISGLHRSLLLRHVHVVSHCIKSVLNEVCEAESFQSIFAWFQFINMWFKFRPPIIDFSRDDRGDRNADMCFCSTGLSVSSSSCLSAMDFPCQLSIFNVGTTPNLWFISMQTREKLS